MMSFADTLHKTRTKARMTRYRLARDAGIDPSYISRLESGERPRPSRHLVLKLGQALLDYSSDLSLKDVNRLLKAARYTPLPKKRISITYLG